MLKSLLRPILFFVALAIAGPACAADIKTEELGLLPVAVLGSEMDLKLWTPELLEKATRLGYSVELRSCIKAPHDRRVGAVVLKPDGKCCVWLDGKEQGVYDQVRSAVREAYRSQEFRFSPDGRRLAYTARKGRKWVMVVDGKESAEFDGLREPYFSHDSKHVCYVGFRGKDCILVMDNKECGKYPGIKMNFPSFYARTPLRAVDDTYCPAAFGPNGRFAFVASKGRGKDGADREVVVIDGKESSEYESVFGIEFSPDGKSVAFAARKGERTFVVLDGKVGPKYDDIEGMLTFSPDGKRLAYLATDFSISGDAQSFVVTDGKPGPKFRDVYSISIMFSPDSKHVTYTATPDGEKYCVVVDGKPGRIYDEIGERNGEMCQMYGPDGRLYYQARLGDKYYMVIDGAASPAYDDILEPLVTLSPSGNHYALSAKSGEHWFVVKDGTKGPAYADICHDSLRLADSGRLAYVGSRLDSLKQVAVIDGNEQAQADRVVLSPDGTATVCMQDSGDWANQITVAFEGQKIGDFADVLSLNFSPDNTLEFLAVRINDTEDRLISRLCRVRASPGGL